MRTIRILKNHKICLVVLFIAGFILVQKASAQTPDKFKTDFYKVNYGGCSHKVQMSVKLIGDNLYSDSHGNIFFLTYDYSDESGKNRIPVFIQRFPNDCADYIDIDTNVDFSSYDLKNYIDIATFRKISEGVYKDTLRFYYYTPMADGGNISIGQASTFIELEKGFYRGSDGLLYIKTQSLINPPEEYDTSFYRAVPEIDVSSYQGNVCEGYGMDKNHVFYCKNTTSGTNIKLLAEADRNTFLMINPYNLSKDKDHVFYYERVVVGLDPALINSQADFDMYLKQIQLQELTDSSPVSAEAQMFFILLNFDKSGSHSDTLFFKRNDQDENFIIWKNDTLLIEWSYTELSKFASPLGAFGLANTFLLQKSASDGCPVDYRLLAFNNDSTYVLTPPFGNCEEIYAFKINANEIILEFPAFPDANRNKENYKFNLITHKLEMVK